MVTDVMGQPDHDKEIIEECSIQCGQRSNLNISPRSVMVNITTTLQNSAAFKDAINVLPKKSTVAKQIQRTSQKELDVPDGPMTWQGFAIPEFLTKTASGEQFLIL